MLQAESIERLRTAFDFWPHLTQEEENGLLRGTEPVFYGAGTAVHNAEQECVGVLVVESGELRTYILSEDGREITLYRVGPGEVCVLSASCVLRSITFDVHVTAERDSRVLLVHASTFAALIEKNIYAENFALRAAVERFSDVMWVVEQILFMRFDRRLAVFLLDETAKIGDADLKLTHQQIAKYIGSAREVVSRTLGHFAETGAVELYRGGVRVLDRGKLRAIL